LFNIDDQETTSLVSLSDFFADYDDGAATNQSRLIRSFRDDRFFGLVESGEETPNVQDLVYASIDVRSFDIMYSHLVHIVS